MCLGRSVTLSFKKQVAKKLEASFPDVPDVSKLQGLNLSLRVSFWCPLILIPTSQHHTPGFDSIVQSAQEIFDQTQAMYHHYLEVTEFLQQVRIRSKRISACVGIVHSPFRDRSGDHGDQFTTGAHARF